MFGVLATLGVGGLLPRSTRGVDALTVAKMLLAAGSLLYTTGFALAGIFQLLIGDRMVPGPDSNPSPSL